MPALAPGDSERLLRFVAEGESFGGDHPFEGEFLTQLGRLVPADWISYGECSGDGRDPHFVRQGDEGFANGIDWAAVMAVVEAECPVFQHVQQGNFAAVKISDFVSRRELYRTPTFKFLLQPYGLKDSLELRLASPRKGE